MAAVTVEDVANQALGLLAESPINSLDDDTKAARLLNLHYETTRQAELVKQAWAFAIFRESLAVDPDAPTSSEYRYAFLVPDDALRVLPLTESGEANGYPIPWKMEGGLILTNYCGPRLVRFIGNMIDPGDWSPLFIEALAARLAMKIAIPLTQKPTFLTGAKNAYEEAIADARRMNAIEASSVPATVSWARERGDWAEYRQ